MTSVRAGRLQELAGGAAHPGTVSLYLDVDGRSRPRLDDCLSAFESLAHQCRVAAGAQGETVAASVRADLDRMRAWLAALDRGDVRGVAFFACAATGRFDVVPLPLAPGDSVAVAGAPDLTRLSRVLDGSPRHLLVLVDRAHARLFEHADGVLTPIEEREAAIPRRHDQGGWSAASIQRHTDELGRRHLAEVAARVAELLAGAPGLRLLVGGPEEDVTTFVDRLHPSLRRRIDARVSVRVGAGADELLRAAAAAREQIAGRHDAEAVASLRTAVERGTAVAGPAATIEALAGRRCAELVLAVNGRRPGWICASCGGVRGAPGTCECGGTLEETEDAGPALVTAALASGCRIRWVEREALSDLGGIAGRLRY